MIRLHDVTEETLPEWQRTALADSGTVVLQVHQGLLYVSLVDSDERSTAYAQQPVSLDLMADTDGPQVMLLIATQLRKRLQAELAQAEARGIPAE